MTCEAFCMGNDFSDDVGDMVDLNFFKGYEVTHGSFSGKIR